MRAPRRGSGDQGSGIRDQGSGARDQGSGTGDQGTEAGKGFLIHEAASGTQVRFCRESGAVYRFEDLIAWQKARTLTREVYGITAGGQFAKDYGLSGQLRRACVSIMSNIAEGHDRRGTKEFQNYLSIAKGSCSEVRSQLYVALDAGYLDDAEFASLKVQAEEVSRVLGGLQKSIAARRSNI